MMKKNVKDLQIALSAMIILAFLTMPLSLNGQAGKADFSGTWALNTEKSNMGGGPGGPPQGQPPQGQGQGMRMGGYGSNFVAKQEANLLTIDRTITRQSGETMNITSKYMLDGKESINTTGRGESKSTATWSSDGKTLKIATSRTFDMNGESRTMVSTEEWTLTDAKILTIKSTTNTPNGERTTKMVYDKK